MEAFVWTGTALGAVIGLLHAVHLYRRQTERVWVDGPRHSRLKGIYYGLWTFLLWTAFGTYVLIFWCLGAAGWLVTWLVSRPAGSRRLV